MYDFFRSLGIDLGSVQILARVRVRVSTVGTVLWTVFCAALWVEWQRRCE